MPRKLKDGWIRVPEEEGGAVIMWLEHPKRNIIASVVNDDVRPEIRVTPEGLSGVDSFAIPMTKGMERNLTSTMVIDKVERAIRRRSG